MALCFFDQGFAHGRAAGRADCAPIRKAAARALAAKIRQLLLDGAVPAEVALAAVLEATWAIALPLAGQVPRRR